jgi:GntR family transcriptional repressor for pyruvate dehydrogenase complex
MILKIWYDIRHELGIRIKLPLHKNTLHSQGRITPLEPMEKVSVTDYVVKNLKELITSGELQVGDKILTEKEICEKLKVSRSSVREALRVLKALGYVEFMPGRGAFVAKTNEDDKLSIANWFKLNEIKIQDLMEVRSTLEILAAKLMIRHARPDDINALTSIHQKFTSAVENYNVVQLVTLDELFHKTIVDGTHNDLLIQIYRPILESLVDYRIKAFSLKENAIHALLPHQNILDAIIHKDEIRAESEVSNHIRISLEDIENVIVSKLKG